MRKNSMRKPPNYQIRFDEEPDSKDHYKIIIIDGAWAGAVFTIGSVRFPDEDKPILQFDYDLETPTPENNIKDLENTIGDILVDMIQRGLEKQELVYKGGT
jgi:hypothetical protein